MSKDVSFQLDPKGGEDILQRMVEPTITLAAQAIAQRATAMANAISTDAPEINVTTQVGIIRRGMRAISTVRATTKNKHQQYIANLVLRKARDAGRV